MAALSRVLRSTPNNGRMFWCPGCDGPHQVLIGEGPGLRWGFNGDVEKPTFTPSILVQWKEGPERSPKVCHSYVTNGRIQFLSDCTHAMAGQTVDIPDFDAGPGWSDGDEP